MLFKKVNLKHFLTFIYGYPDHTNLYRNYIRYLRIITVIKNT